MLQVHQDGGDDLGVLVADQVGHRAGIHPLQAFDARGLAALEDAGDEVGGLVVAQGLGQHIADVGIRIHVHRGMFVVDGVEFFQHRFHPGPGHGTQGGHGVAELLHFPGAELLQQPRRRFPRPGRSGVWRPFPGHLR